MRKVNRVSVNTRIAAFFGATALAIAGTMAAKYEGTRYTAYQDVGGIWTLCKGHTHGVKQGDKATPEQCVAWLREDLEAANTAFNSCVQEEVSTEERAAYVDLIYNIGSASFCHSTLVRKLNTGDHKGACNEISRWVYANGNDCRILENNCIGIVKRRADERELCFQGL